MLADLYNMVNVPTIVWIDEEGRIARPNDVAFGTDAARRWTGQDASRHMDALRAWVRDGRPALSEEEIRAFQKLPTASEQQARAEFGLGQWLFDQGHLEAAASHFSAGGELAPHDFIIRRGTMSMRGLNPMGAEFAEMVRDWAARGNSYYLPLPK